ncbi:MAG: substrate-binding domain-containing protein [Nevskia sp.]|nr:substrate-binding domain-containing protein [Nevskia sp.]
MSHSSRSLIAAAALVFTSAAGAATIEQPSVILYGGGATFPINAYVGDSWLDAVPNRRLSNTLPPAAGAKVNSNAAEKASLFVEFAKSTAASGTPDQKTGRVGVSYCQGGSGVGRGIIQNTLVASAPCGDYGTGTPAGVSAPTRKADFGGSDAPLAQSDVNAFNATAGSPAQNYGELYSQQVQIPAVVGSVAVVYNNAAVGKKQVNLTRSDICGIFSGSITDWSQLTSTPKVTIASKPIKVITRSDSSGTTFSFTNFLSAACPGLNAPGDTAVTGFKTVNVFSGGLPTGATLPAGSLAVSGNGGVVTAVAATDGAIGYADVADTVSRSKREGGDSLKFATVSRSKDLAKGTPGVIPPGGDNVVCVGSGKVFVASPTKAVKYTCPAVVYNKLSPSKNLLAKKATGLELNVSLDKVLGANDANGRPTVLDVTGQNASAVPGCLLTVLPNDYAQPPVIATKKAAQDFATYPVIAVSYLIATGTGNGAKLADVQALLGASFNPTILATTKTIGKTTGFAPLTLKLNGAVVDVPATVAACVRG